MVEVLVPLATMDVGDAVMVEVATLAAPGVKVTVSESAMVTPFTIPVMIELLAVVEEVNVAVYVPFPLSVTVEIVPAVFESATLDPPVVRLFPLESVNCTVMIDVLIPSAMILTGEAVITELFSSGGPGTNATVSVSEIATPPRVPEIIEFPTFVAEVNMAV